MRWEWPARVCEPLQTSPDEMQGHGILWYASLGLVIELRSIACSVCWGILHNTQMDSSYVVRKCPAAKKQKEKGSFTVQMDS